VVGPDLRQAAQKRRGSTVAKPSSSTWGGLKARGLAIGFRQFRHFRVKLECTRENEDLEM